MVNKCSCSDTVGLLESREVLGLLAGIVSSIKSCEVDASISVSNSGRYIVNNREQFVGLNMDVRGFSVIPRAVLRQMSGVPRVSVMVKQCSGWYIPVFYNPKTQFPKKKMR